jgi:hypothetical protein|tara:strand:- start:77 stop:346 length:270 start_codon:yes stop_codon:yes gene_type:complete
VSNLSAEQKGRRAKEILADPVFLEVLERVRENIVAQWTLTELNESSVRENLYMQGKGLDEIVRGLRTLVGDWAMEQSRNVSKSKRGRKS